MISGGEGVMDLWMVGLMDGWIDERVMWDLFYYGINGNYGKYGN